MGERVRVKVRGEGEGEGWAEHDARTLSLSRPRRPAGRYGEIWGDMGRHGEIWGDMGRYGEIWADHDAQLGDGRDAGERERRLRGGHLGRCRGDTRAM